MSIVRSTSQTRAQCFAIGSSRWAETPDSSRTARWAFPWRAQLIVVRESSEYQLTPIACSTLARTWELVRFLPFSISSTRPLRRYRRLVKSKAAVGGAVYSQSEADGGFSTAPRGLLNGRARVQCSPDLHRRIAIMRTRVLR